jgi:carbamoyltransferase
MNILSCNYNHDGSAAILKDGKIAGYVNTERFTRIKKHPGVTKQAFNELFKMANIAPSEIDMYILNNLNYMFSPVYYSENNGYYQNTWENFLIRDDTRKDLLSKDRFFDIKDYGLDLVNKDFFPKVSNFKLNFSTSAHFRNFQRSCLVNIPHYVLHAAAAYYTSPFKSATIFVWDPTGFEAFIGFGNKIFSIFNDSMLNFINFGRIYAEMSETILLESSLTSAGKLMGLAAYGKSSLDKKFEDFNLFSNSNYANIFDLIKNESNKNPKFYQEKHMKLDAKAAFITQSLLESQLEYMFKFLYQYALVNNIEPNICISGGTGLNCAANEKAFSNSKFKNIFMHPASGDDGTALGGALYHWHHTLDNPKESYSNSELMYSKKCYSNFEVEEAVKLFGAEIQVRKTDNYINTAARFIADGKVIAWYEGGSEIGPRALGHRSILGDPRSVSIRDFLNLEVKSRESYRPLAPSILKEYAKEWFGIEESPFMLRSTKILKDSLPGIAHVDGTSRPQVLDAKDNPNYYNLILSFFKITGIPMILDTSFNIKGEPIVETPEDALKSFLRSKIDALVFPGLIITKR